jgi:hypothetical protein
LCLQPKLGRGHHRLAAEVKQPFKQWQTPLVGGLLNTQPANLSVKGTSCAYAQDAPYVER